MPDDSKPTPPEQPPASTTPPENPPAPEAPATTPPSVPAPPTAPAEPEMPKPSATVEPFQSAGGPPPPEKAPKKGLKGMAVLLVVVVLLAVAAAAYFAVTSGMVKLGSSAKPSPSASPAASVLSDIDKSYQDTDAGIGQLTNDLNNVDTALGDKQGDLSE